jgi:hypothetical protein
MNHKDGNDPNNLGGFGDMLSPELLRKLNELLEKMQQAGHTNQGGIVINIFEKGSQHVDHVDNQNFYGYPCPKQEKTPKGEDASTAERFGKDTPLSALFRENHHEELKTIIESWRPYLIGDDTTVDALAMTHFEFDKKRIYSNCVYYDLLDLEALGALQVSLSQLACYLADHSNLSSSHATLYRQLKKYRQERPL